MYKDMVSASYNQNKNISINNQFVISVGTVTHKSISSYENIELFITLCHNMPRTSLFER